MFEHVREKRGLCIIRRRACKQTRVGSKKAARRLGRSNYFSMRFFFPAREEARLSLESDFNLNGPFLAKLFRQRGMGMTRKNRVRKSKMADIISSKQTKIRSIKVARRLGRSRSFSIRFFFLAREKMKLSYESDLKVNEVFLRKLFGKRSQKNGGHFNVVLNACFPRSSNGFRWSL